MKKTATLGLIGVLWLSIVPTASAHTLKADGAIGAVLHIDPNDDPIAGQPATFFFDLKDRTEKFSLTACDCTASIKTEGTEIYATPLSSLASFSYTFPEKALYTVSLTGTPKTAGDFQPFTLTYSLRVDREVSAPIQKTPGITLPIHFVHYVLFGIPFIIVFGIYFHDLYRERKIIKIKSL